MSYNKQTTSSESLIKMIKKEQRQIELDTKEVAELARIVTDYVKRIETVNEVSDVEVISSPPYREIKKKLISSAYATLSSEYFAAQAPYN